MELIKPITKNAPIFRSFPEEWKEIDYTVLPNILKGYYISTFGRVYSALSNRILQQSLHKGYHMIGLYDIFKKQYMLSVHRIVMIMFNPVNNMNNLQVNHKIPVTTANHECNLEWVTAKENIAHAMAHNLIDCTRCNGQNNPMAVLTNDQVHIVCKLIQDTDMDNIQIAKVVGCTPKRISAIRNKECWTSVSDTYILKGLYPLPYTTMNKICEFFENNISKYTSDSSLYKAACDYVNIQFDEKTRAVMRRLKHRSRYEEITIKYKY